MITRARILCLFLHALHARHQLFGKGKGDRGFGGKNHWGNPLVSFSCDYPPWPSFYPPRGQHQDNRTTQRLKLAGNQQARVKFISLVRQAASLPFRSRPRPPQAPPSPPGRLQSPPGRLQSPPAVVFDILRHSAGIRSTHAYFKKTVKKKFFIPELGTVLHLEWPVPGPLARFFHPLPLPGLNCPHPEHHPTYPLPCRFPCRYPLQNGSHNIPYAPSPGQTAALPPAPPRPQRALQPRAGLRPGPHHVRPVAALPAPSPPK